MWLQKSVFFKLHFGRAAMLLLLFFVFVTTIIIVHFVL